MKGTAFVIPDAPVRCPHLSWAAPVRRGTVARPKACLCVRDRKCRGGCRNETSATWTKKGDQKWVRKAPVAGHGKEDPHCPADCPDHPEYLGRDVGLQPL